MAQDVAQPASTILTPDQRLRIFISSTLTELQQERVEVADAIRTLRMTPVMFEAGARPHPPRDLYRSYLAQSHIFIGIYWESYGWIADDMDVSGLEEEVRLSQHKPRLIYVKEPAPNRDPRLAELLEKLSVSGVSYRKFAGSDELRSLVAEDLAILLTESSGIMARENVEETPRSQLPLPPLPVPASSFVGREAELRSLLDLLGRVDVRLITLTGPGGIGKTRLALEAARRAGDIFPDGVAFVSLDAIRDPDFVLQAIAAQLEVRDAEHTILLESVSERLRNQRALLLLDNFEHVLSGATAVSDLLAAADGINVLSTSRAPLELRGEHVVDVGPLAGPDGSGEPSGLSAAERLFIDRAEAVSGMFKKTTEDLAAIADIVDAVDGVPLALELAAARLRALSPRAIADRLRGCMDILRMGPRDLPERQQAIRSTVQWSYDLLDASERVLFQRLAVFSGGADLAAIEEVCGAELDDVLSTTGSLIDKSLLGRVEMPAGDLRVRMLAIIREYAAEKLVEAEANDDTRSRHARYFREFAERAQHEMWSAEEPRWLDALGRDHQNLRAALRWFVSKEMTDESLRLAVSLRWFWWIRGHLSIGEHWLRQALALPGGSPVARGRALVAAGALSIDLGELRRGREMAEEALALLESEGTPTDVAWAHTALGSILQSLGLGDEAESFQRQALAAFDAGGSPLGQCTASTALASIEWSRGHYALAESHYRDSLKARRRVGDPWGTAYVLTALGWTRILQHDNEEAAEYLREAEPLFRKVRSLDGLANALNGLGYVAADEGRWNEAIALCEQALELFREVGNRPLVALELSRLARAHLFINEPERSFVFLREALEITGEVEERDPSLFAVEGLACLLAVGAHHVEAARLFGAVDCLRRRDQVLSDQTLPLSRGAFEDRVRDALGDGVAEGHREEGCRLDHARLRAEVENGLVLAALRVAPAPTL